MIVLDTTVLVYAVGTEHRFREPCRRLIAAIRNGDVTATTTIEAIQEFAHVRARRRSRDDAAALASSYIDLLSPLLIVEEADLREGLRVFAASDQLGSFDAVLVAASAAVGADAIVSADAAFASAASTTHIVPDEDGVAKLLRPGPDAGTSD